jgi:hypothetical protein
MRFLFFVTLTLALVACQGNSSSNPPTSPQPPSPPSPPPSGSTPNLGGCDVFPSNNIWNARVDALPVEARSSAYVNSIGSGVTLHPDFGAGLYRGGPIGIPFKVVPASQPGVTISFGDPDESDPGPYPVPADAPVEGGPSSSGDRHVLILRQGECKLYELANAYPNANGSWRASWGATWDLNTNALRPAGWSSADAAGLPILPGLVRYEEIAAGKIDHAIRFTAPVTQRAYVWPARHFASSNTDPNVPPMGQRFRLKASFDLSGFSRDTRVILEAMKTHGIILADNGSAWYVTGAPDERWNNDQLNAEFDRVRGSDFEAVDVSSLRVDANSGEAKPR